MTQTLFAKAEPVEGLGTPVRGPSAIGDDPRRLWQLTVALAITDFKLRFFGSALGYLWQLVRPLLLFGVLYVLFSEVLSLADAPFYAEALLLALVLYTFFSDATKGSLGSLVARESLVRKIEFPRLAVPLAVVLNALFNLGLNLLPVFAFLLIDGGAVRWQWLLLPFLLLALVAYATGLALLLSSLYVRFRDLEPIWDVTLSVLFYGTPIFYTVSMVQDRVPELAKWVLVNPLATVVQEARFLVLGPGHESAAAAAGSGWFLLLPVGLAVAVIVLGAVVFSRRAPLIAEEL